MTLANAPRPAGHRTQGAGAKPDAGRSVECANCDRAGVARGRLLCTRCEAADNPTPLQLWARGAGYLGEPGAARSQSHNGLDELAEDAGLARSVVALALRGDPCTPAIAARLSALTRGWVSVETLERPTWRPITGRRT